MPRRTKLEKLARARERTAGVEKHYQGHEVVAATMTADELLRRIALYVAAVAATAQAEAVYLKAVAHERKLESELGPHLRALDRSVYGRWGNDRSVLLDFGMEPEGKPGPKTRKAKLEMVAKQKATRLARGTMGPRQRKRSR
jgi:hypothetical protein